MLKYFNTSKVPVHFVTAKGVDCVIPQKKSVVLSADEASSASLNALVKKGVVVLKVIEDEPVSEEKVEEIKVEAKVEPTPAVTPEAKVKKSTASKKQEADSSESVK